MESVALNGVLSIIAISYLIGWALYVLSGRVVLVLYLIAVIGPTVLAGMYTSTTDVTGLGCILTVVTILTVAVRRPRRD